jgi:hypothetical protein
MTNNNPVLRVTFATAALLFLAMCIACSAWLAQMTVQRGFSPAGNPAWVAWPVVLASPLLVTLGTWTVWCADYFNRPRGQRWSRATKWRLLLPLASTTLSASVAVRCLAALYGAS